jgi:BirA family biotin operon repressor/biotin-[acetyl-CoA-carboxylase] ligase
MPSTNAAAKDWPFGALPAPALFLTEYQSAGRGRSQNTWQSSPGSLLSSWVFESGHAPQPVLAPLIGLALYRSAKAAWPQVAWSLKPPNDLYAGSKKVAGLLIETIALLPTYRVIVGLGLNIGSHPVGLESASSVREAMIPRGDQLELIRERDVHRFLDHWWAELGLALKFGILLRMPPQSCKDLRSALNARPGLSETIAAVTPEGSLIMRSATHEREVPWHSL